MSRRGTRYLVAEATAVPTLFTIIPYMLYSRGECGIKSNPVMKKRVSGGLDGNVHAELEKGKERKGKKSRDTDW